MKIEKYPCDSCSYLIRCQECPDYHRAEEMLKEMKASRIEIQIQMKGGMNKNDNNRTNKK